MAVTTDSASFGFGGMSLTETTIFAMSRSVLRRSSQGGIAPNHGQSSSQNGGGK